MGPSGEQFEIQAAGYRAVVTEAGATLRVLTHEDRPLLMGFAEDEICSAGAGQPLVPWPNRVRDGHWSFAGRDLQLPLSEPARHNASHGLTRWLSWQPLARTDAAISLGARLLAQPGYPWTLDLELVYALGVDGLVVELTATNLSGDEAPFGCGFHPYLSAGSSKIDGDTLTVPAPTRLLVDPERLLPTGHEQVAGSAYDFREGRVLGDLALDTAFTDLGRDHEGDRVHVLLGAPDGGGTELWAGAEFGWLQLFTGESVPARSRRALAVEPMTCPPDAFNSGEGLIVLPADGTFRGSWGIRALPTR